MYGTAENDLLRWKAAVEEVYPVGTILMIAGRLSGHWTVVFSFDVTLLSSTTIMVYRKKI